MVRGTHSPRKVNSVNKREGSCNTARYSYPPKPRPWQAGNHRLNIQGHTDPLPAGTDVLRRAQPTTSDGTSRHHSTDRTALTILTTKLSTATQARHPHDPQNTARYGARQAGRHEQEHRTTELEQHPGAPMGSTGTHQGGRTGPCHRRGGVHMNCTGKTGRTATEHREIPDDGLCMQHCRGGAGKRAPNLEKKNFLQRSDDL